VPNNNAKLKTVDAGKIRGSFSKGIFQRGSTEHETQIRDL